MYGITIRGAEGAFPEAFIFPLQEKESAWYELDGSGSVSGSALLTLNADREVYAIYTGPDGVRHYGVIGDEENESIPDNFGIEDGEIYLFREHPETENYYI